MLTLVFWDVQHGSATYIGMPNGQHLALDLGTGSLGSGGAHFSLLRYLRDRMHVQQLNALLISHPHRDHLDDIFSLDVLSPLALFRPRHLTAQDIAAGNRPQDKTVIDRYIQIDALYTQPLDNSTSPASPSQNGGVSVQFFQPTACPKSNLNDHSMVTVIEYHGFKFLLPGDNEAPSWKELLSQPEFCAAIQGTDILLAPHHGREAGYCADLFAYIHPRLTVVSDGPFGDTSATNRYSQHSKGWSVHRRNGQEISRHCLTTRKDGAIMVRCGLDGALRYLEVTID